jgi:energy-coupling factor transporter ATP-binding protein EcfA2
MLCLVASAGDHAGERSPPSSLGSRKTASPGVIGRASCGRPRDTAGLSDGFGVSVALVIFTTEFGAHDEPYVRVAARRWNDAREYKTLFEVVLHEGGNAHLLGTVKILQQGETHTQLPRSFEVLPDSYCSLGQSLRYDREVENLQARPGVDVHGALRDIRGLADAQRDAFTTHPGFKTSLLRFAPARYLYASKFGGLPQALQVDLRVDLSGFDAPHVLPLDLDPNRLLGRVAVIIGENGTGKTRLLDAVARALSGIETKWIAKGTPSVSRVIALSCNAFDQFLIPEPIIEGSYVYVGLRSKTGMIDVEDIAASLVRSFNDDYLEWLHLPPSRFKLWQDVMRQIGLAAIADDDIIASGDQLKAIAQLGAGLKFACYTMTRLVREIEDRSFVLFDEPETHTHPRLLSMMMRALHLVLEQFKSFALVATHSPLVVQEVPAKQVHILRCSEGSYPNISKPVDETFGASLGELLRKIFSIDYQERNFDVLVRELVERHGVARVRDQLGDEFALSARLLLDKLDEAGEDPS